MRRVGSFGLLIVAACTCGCGADTVPGADVAMTATDAHVAIDRSTPDAPTTAPSVELGTGAREWIDLPTDGTGRCEVVFGPQGGYHIFGRVRVRGFAPSVTMLFTVTSVETSATLTDTRDRIQRFMGRGLLVTSDGFESTSGELVILQIRGPMEVARRRFRMEVRVEEMGTARVLTTSREFTIIDDEP